MLPNIPNLKFAKDSLKFLRRMSTTPPTRTLSPAAKSSQSQEFFSYTSGRWLWDEDEQKALRYVEFDVDALKKTAAAAVGAARCTEMSKTHEGYSSKVFSMKFDNGAELIAKIPCPKMTTPHLGTASEVATMDYARSVLEFPVPQVHAWSSQAAATDVGVEYILMDKAAGVPLSARLDALREDAKVLVDDVNGIERKFVERRFSQFGSIYYKEDVEPALQARSLYAHDERGRLDSAASERFRVGPLVLDPEGDAETVLRCHTSGASAAKRGPWPDVLSYITGVVRAEQEWLRQCAKPRPPHDPFYISEEHHSPDAHIELMDGFLATIPHFIPPSAYCVPVLWHPALHVDALRVARAGAPHVCGVLDWRGAAVLPLFLQADFAPWAYYTGDARIAVERGRAIPQPPAGADALPAAERRALETQMRRALFHKLYEFGVVGRNAIQRGVWDYPHRDDIAQAVQRAGRTWDAGLHTLRQSLVLLGHAWADVAPPDAAFPLPWDFDAVQVYIADIERLRAYERRVAGAVRRLGVGGDGWVPAARHEEGRRGCAELERTWDAREEGGPFPFQSGSPFGWMRLLPGRT